MIDRLNRQRRNISEMLDFLRTGEFVLTNQAQLIHALEKAEKQILLSLYWERKKEMKMDRTTENK